MLRRHFLQLGLAAPVAAAEAPLRWWKGNLHTHSLWSDGDQFPEMVAEWYREHGYHFLALSDHNVMSRGERWEFAADVDKRAQVDAVARYVQRYGEHWVELRGEGARRQVRLKTLEEVKALVEERGRFLMLDSEELTGNTADGRALHMNATNLGDLVPFQTGSNMRESILRNLQAVEESARRTGRETLVHVNHPNYRWGLTAEDLAAVLGEGFMEIWNGVDNDNDPGDGVRRPDSETMWDIANTLRIAQYRAAPLLGVATDDTHDHHGNKTRAMPGRAWIMVRARYLTPEHLLRAMRRGDFYASTGVVLDEVAFDAKARRLSVKMAAQGRAEFVTRFIGAQKGVNLRGKARRDAQGEVLETTLDYRTASGPQMGEVLAEVRGREAAYTLRGDELYVRAQVTSNAKPEVPSQEHPFQRAWTQPVGW